MLPLNYKLRTLIGTLDSLFIWANKQRKKLHYFGVGKGGWKGRQCSVSECLIFLVILGAPRWHWRMCSSLECNGPNFPDSVLTLTLDWEVPQLSPQGDDLPSFLSEGEFLPGFALRPPTEESPSSPWDLPYLLFLELVPFSSLARKDLARQLTSWTAPVSRSRHVPSSTNGPHLPYGHWGIPRSQLWIDQYSLASLDKPRIGENGTSKAAGDTQENVWDHFLHESKKTLYSKANC